MKKFLNAQLENSSKTDWTYQVKRDLKELEIKLTLEDIGSMSKNKFKNHIMKKIESAALKYLKSKIKSKGQELEYINIELQDYLRPETSIKLQEKQDMFKMRSRMIDIGENMRGKSTNFKCEACKKNGKKKKETQPHIYKCKHFNKERNYVDYNKIFGNKTNKIKKFMKRMNLNLTVKQKKIKIKNTI